MRHRLAPLLALPLGLIGCGSSSPPPAPVAAAPAVAAADDRPLVDDPDYQNWKAFPVHTTVTRKKVSRNEHDSVTEVLTLRLVEVTAAKVVVESQVTVERPNARPVMNPPTKREYPARFRLPPGMTAEQFQKPSLKAKASGEETLTVGGKAYRAAVFTWEDATEAGPMPNKLWQSDAMPGRLVKQQMSVAKVGNTTTEEVVAVTVP